jgi:hypothetical protein
MDNPFRQPEPDTQRSNGVLLASLQFIDGILQWLASLVQLTEEEQEDAGIYLDGQHDR